MRKADGQTYINAHIHILIFYNTFQGRIRIIKLSMKINKSYNGDEDTIPVKD